MIRSNKKRLKGRNSMKFFRVVVMHAMRSNKKRLKAIFPLLSAITTIARRPREAIRKD